MALDWGGVVSQFLRHRRALHDLGELLHHVLVSDLRRQEDDPGLLEQPAQGLGANVSEERPRLPDLPARLVAPGARKEPRRGESALRRSHARAATVYSAMGRWQKDRSRSCLVHAAGWFGFFPH